MGYIYKITNKKNSKSYIGKTTRDLEIRFDEHKKRVLNHNFKNSYLYNTMYKEGIDNFSFEEIEFVENNDELNERERYWISYYHTYIGDDNCWGYNLTPGGDGRSLPQNIIDLIEELYFLKQYSIKEVSEELNISYSTIYHRLANHKNFDSEENKKRSFKPYSLKVDKYTINGEYIETFDSLNKAAKSINSYETRVSEAIRMHGTAGGYCWTWSGEPFEYSSNNRQKILQFDLEGNFIRSYPSAREAAKNMKVDSSSIINVANNKSISCKNSYWIYAKDYYEGIIDIKIQRYKKTQRYRGKKVLCVELNKIFNTVSEARKATGATKISEVCNGKRKSSGGYTWKYVD